ncbi:MAG: sigma-54-dependent Fis family transcriptional regulator [Proteobacteria bacterium]|nr:sigma-54-dependent Fis family transcriptional regulator [Pseudomonadota bacterium]
MENSILVVDDEQDFLDSIRRGLVTSGFKNVTIETDPRRAVEMFEKGIMFDVVLIDITMPGMNGIELLEVIRSNSPRSECIMVTAVDEARVAVQSLRKGAYDYLVKPISKEDLVSSLNRALERKRLFDILDLGKAQHVPKLKNVEAFKAIVSRSDKVLRILKEAELHAASDVPVLLTGETGTGKELLARAIHASSTRNEYVFTPINMDSLTDQLFNAEFFGHTRGAFTGAEKERVGYLEYTHQGTLFLDEIGNLRPELQGKLLRVLQDGEFIKIGTSKPQKTDTRFIAATNKDIERLMSKGQFRKDLYYRLRGGWLHLPPLRDRKDDIPLLIERFLKEYCGERGANFEEATLNLLMNYDYPGNIRELKSIIQSAVNLSQGKPIAPRHLPVSIQKIKSKSKTAVPAGAAPIIPLADVEKKHILNAYNQTQKNKSQTAELLGIGVNTLRRKLKSYGV